MKYIKYIVAALILVLAVGAVAFLQTPQATPDTDTPVPGNTDNGGGGASDALDPSGANIQVTLPDKNDAIGLPLTIKGYARVFENQFAYRVKDQDGTVLTEGFAMSDAADSGVFGAFTIVANYPAPKGTKGTVEVFEYSAKDGSEVNKVSVPVSFAAVSSQNVAVYFTNEKKSGSSTDCALVYPVTRRVAKTEAIGRAALDELLRGVDVTEEKEGFTSSLNRGSVIKMLDIKNGTATVRFNDVFQAGVAGSCRVTAIRSQIESTLKQFPTVKRVVIEVEGMPTDEVLQP